MLLFRSPITRPASGASDRRLHYPRAGPQPGFKVWGGKVVFIICLKQIFLGTTQFGGNKNLWVIAPKPRGLPSGLASHWSSCSQTCSSRYPNQGSDYLITLNISQLSLITQNIVVLVPCYSPKNRILPHDWKPLHQNNIFGILWGDEKNTYNFEIFDCFEVKWYVIKCLAVIFRKTCRSTPCI